MINKTSIAQLSVLNRCTKGYANNFKILMLNGKLFFFQIKTTNTESYMYMSIVHTQNNKLLSEQKTFIFDIPRVPLTIEPVTLKIDCASIEIILTVPITQ